jgi:hypothetical protein
MFALVFDDDNIQIARNFINLMAPTGVFFTDVRLIDKEIRVANKVYDFVPSTAVPNNFSVLVSSNFLIDDENGVVTEIVVWEYPEVQSVIALKTQEFNQQANSLLTKTDQQVLHNIELNVPNNSALVAYRANIRKALQNAIADINNCTDCNEIAQYMVNWPSQ